MHLISIIICYTILMSFLLGQGAMNAFGLGHFYHNQGIVSAANGVNDLVPAFQDKISLSNPSTWQNLKYTHLSLSYSGDKNSFSNPSLINEYSGLSNAYWIVPIKTKWSFGLSIRPYADQRISINQSSDNTFIAFGDTLNLVHSIKRSGGIMSFKVGTSFLAWEKLSLGISLDLLFGSSRQSELLFFDGSAIIQSSRTLYTGTLNNFYIASQFDNNNFYMSFMYPTNSLDGLYTERHLFDDSNGNGYHDYGIPADFPFPDSVTAENEERIFNIHKPTQLSFGYQTKLEKLATFSIEASSFIDRGDPTQITLPVNDWIDESNQIKLSVTRFPNDLSLDLIDKFSFRIGIVGKSHNLAGSGMNVAEVGGALGIGFKFKLTGNQIDLNYYHGKRDYSETYDTENIQQIQIGVSLADLWFVKRRQK